jgi:hypothetical protein
MKKAPNLLRLVDLVHELHHCKVEADGGVWIPARPLGFYSIHSRLKLAWMVFTGKADALLWPGGQ